MKIYTAALIDKPQRIRNADLRKNMASDLKKLLRVKRSSIVSQELNSFIFLSAETANGRMHPELVEKIEKGVLFNRFISYNKKNESKYRNLLQNNQELRETSQIVKNFIKEIDGSLPRKLDQQMKKVNTDLPRIFCELSTKSFITLWDIEEANEYRFYLSGFDFPLFCGSTADVPINIGGVVDQLLIANFFVGRAMRYEPRDKNSCH